MGRSTWGKQDGHCRDSGPYMTGTFRKEGKEFEGGGFGVDSWGQKRSWFWMGEDKRWWLTAVLTTSVSVHTVMKIIYFLNLLFFSDCHFYLDL